MTSREPAAADYAAVIFDLGGVVFRYHPEKRLAGFARLTGLPPDALHKRLVASGYSRSCDSGRLKGEAAYREGVRLLGARLSLERFRELWVRAFEPDTAVVEIARRAKARVSLAMLSNNSDLVRAGLESRYGEVLELFRPRLFSADAGLMKPDPRLFRTLLELMGLPAERVLYVDDESAHVAAAAALGLATHHFTDAADLRRALTARGCLGPAPAGGTPGRGTPGRETPGGGFNRATDS